MKRMSWQIYLTIFSFIMFVDRYTKYLVMQGATRYVVAPFLSIDLVYNKGISWGLFQAHDFISFIVMNFIIGAIICALIVHAIYRIMHKKNILGEVLIFAGAISNYTDRFFYQGVVDFIAFSYQNWYFPIFNIADVCIVLGVSIIFILEYAEPCKD